MMIKALKYTILLLTGIVFGQKVHALQIDIRKEGASGNPKQLVTAVVQKAIDRCTAAGGGQVYFPAGKYTCGAVTLKSNVSIYLEAGAEILASQQEKDYRVDNYQERYRHPVLFYADKADHISIRGKGKINGQAQREYLPLDETDSFIEKETELAKNAGIDMKQYYKKDPVTYLVFLVNCEDVLIEDVTLYESCAWTLHLQWCRDITIRGARIYSDLEKGVNADGIDIDGCTNATISDCIIETGDDAIVLKSTLSQGRSQPCENIAVNNCLLVSTSTALKIGTETYSDFRFIRFNNCIIRNSNRGLSIVVRDGATVSDVHFSNITMELNRKHFNWWGNADAIWLVVMKRNAGSRIGHIRNIHFSNIHAYAQGTSKIEGYEGHPLENISLNHVYIHMEDETLPDRRADYGLYAHHINGLTLNDLKITYDLEKPSPTWKDALLFEKVDCLNMNQVYTDVIPLKIK